MMRAPLRPLAYLAIAAVAALAQLSLLYGFASTHYFVSHAAYAFDAIADEKVIVTGADADVLFVGDSAVATGVDPGVIKRDTGFSAYNLGVTVSAYAYDPEFLVDHYLAHNKPPRIIVLYATPWHVGDPDIPIYEAAGMILRHGSLREMADFFLRTPQHLIDYAHQIMVVAASSTWDDSKYRAVVKVLRENAGFVPMDDLPGARADFGRLKDYDAFCRSGYYRRPVDAAFFARFRHEYTRPGTTVLIYAAPLPDCNNSARYYAEQFGPLVDNAPYTLPHALFVLDIWKFHLTQRGAELNSALVSEWLLDRAWSLGIANVGTTEGAHTP